MGTKLALSTAYHAQTDGLSERMIQTLEDMIRRYCSFGIEYKDSEGFVHNWVSLLPALEFAYNSSKHSTTNKAPFELERGYTPRVPRMLLNKHISEPKIHPGAERLNNMLVLARTHAKECIDTAFEYAKERWDKTHKESPIQVGDLVMVSTINFTNLQGARKLQDAFVGPFPVIRKHGPNVVELELSAPFDRKHPTFPVSLIKLYKTSDEKRFPKRRVKVVIPELDKDETGEIQKILREQQTKVEGRIRREYLVRYKGRPSEEDQWLQESKITNGDHLLQKFRVAKRNSK